MFMTQEADNAVRIVHNLASHNARRDAKSISEETGVTLRFSLKILRKLVEQGVAKSFMGKYGGYELAKPPAEISVGEVIRAIDGPFALNRCLRDEHSCPSECDCMFREVYADISDMITTRLDKLTFDGFLTEA